MVHDRLRDDGAEPRHPVGEPSGNASAVQRQISASGSLRHGSELLAVLAMDSTG
jgi:hypothetical protein